MKQTKIQSLTESVCNIAVGYFIAVLTAIIVFPLFGVETSFTDSLGITACFTVVSLARSYLIRRFFNSIEQPTDNLETTHRGFGILSFEDNYGEECSLQKSSRVFPDCVWLGIQNVRPRILCSSAGGLGIAPKGLTGWQDYPLPDDVFISSRMHLDQDQVKKLLPALITFAETGELS